MTLRGGVGPSTRVGWAARVCGRGVRHRWRTGAAPGHHGRLRLSRRGATLSSAQAQERDRTICPSGCTGIRGDARGGKALRDAWDLDSASRAARALERLAGSNKEREDPGAAASIREGLDETLTVQRLGLTGASAANAAHDEPHREPERQRRALRRGATSGGGAAARCFNAGVASGALSAIGGGEALPAAWTDSYESPSCLNTPAQRTDFFHGLLRAQRRRWPRRPDDSTLGGKRAGGGGEALPAAWTDSTNGSDPGTGYFTTH